MPPPVIVIDQARRADARQMALMSRDLIEHGLGWSWTRERVLGSLRSAITLVAAARSGGRLIGFGIMRYGDDVARLDLLGVAADWRSRGVGRQLVEWLERPALVSGIRQVSLEVRASNRGAQAFYERLGYRTRAQIAGYYQGRETALRMQRELGRGPSSADVSAEVDAMLRRLYRSDQPAVRS
jgi:ribosomal-protein-alanine N-acetyltransferase